MDASFVSSVMSPAGIGAAAALATGLFGSGHCALMCGPLACAGLDRAGAPDRRARRRSAWAWQLGRLGAYAVAGAALGGFGRAVMGTLVGPGARAVPWIMAAGLVLSALGVGAKVRRAPVLAQIPRRLARAGARISPPRRAALRGLATPFLPCGLLYGAFLMAAGAASVAGGALVMAAFGLGSVPALALVQALVPGGGARLAAHPRAAAFARRAIPLVAAVVLVWRAVAAQSGAAAPHCH
jgi:sulfite exporter TauE/SafE